MLNGSRRLRRYHAAYWCYSHGVSTLFVYDDITPCTSQLSASRVDSCKPVHKLSTYIDNDIVLAVPVTAVIEHVDRA